MLSWSSSAPLAVTLPSSLLGPISSWPVTILDAAGLSLFAVAGTGKALEHRVHPLPACFLGTVGAVGGGVLRDLLRGEVPHILHSDIYASAAFVAAAIVAGGRALGLSTRAVAVLAGTTCFALRLVAVAYDWQLPKITPA